MTLAINMMRAYLGSLIPALDTQDEGQGMVEYVMIIGAISIVLVAAFITTGLSTAVTTQVNNLVARITPH